MDRKIVNNDQDGKDWGKIYFWDIVEGNMSVARFHEQERGGEETGEA